MSDSLRSTRRDTGTFWRPNVTLFAGICARTYAHYLKIPWLKLELENHSQKLRNAMSSLWDWWLKRGMKKSQIHVKNRNWEINDCLKWLSMKQNNIWHRPTLALIGRRGLNYGKKGELNGRPDRWNRILVFYLIQGGVESHLLVGSSFPDTI